jgi:hypothetical protein
MSTGLSPFNSVERHESLWIANRQPPQQEGIDETEDRGVRADAERERENGDEGERGRAPQRPERVLQIAPCIVDPTERPRIAMKLLRLLDPAERQPRGMACLFRQHPSAQELIFEDRQMRGNFALELRLPSARLQRIEKSL